MSAAEISPALAARRKTITLPESEIVVKMRVLTRLDHIDARAALGSATVDLEGLSVEETGKVLLPFLLRGLELSVISPRLVVAGLPSDEMNSSIHVRDLPDADYDCLVEHFWSFAVGGARREQLKSAEGEGSGNAGSPGEKVRAPTKRARRSA